MGGEVLFEVAAGSSRIQQPQRHPEQGQGPCGHPKTYPRRFNNYGIICIMSITPGTVTMTEGVHYPHRGLGSAEIEVRRRFHQTGCEVVQLGQLKVTSQSSAGDHASSA